ncbi:MAG: ATP-binding protein, partial [Salegentibacter sp.]
LEYSRAGRNELKMEKIDLNKLMEHITGLCYEAIQEKKAEVNWKNLPVIYSSKTPLQQVFLNFLRNALKYSKTEEPPVINIAVEEKNSEWIFSISDNGIGIDSDFHEKIFVVFQRLHRREEFSGTGIGLAICKKIIERLGGSIWLESSEGAGSTFYFSLQKQF